MQKIIKLKKKKKTSKNEVLRTIKESFFVCLILHFSKNMRQRRDMLGFGVEDAMTT